MGDRKEGKRRKDSRVDDDDNRQERKSKKARSKSRSPDRSREKDHTRKRRRSRSVSNERPPKQEKQRDGAPDPPEVKKEGPPRKNKDIDMLNTRTGGAYIPPARLRLMQAQITDKSSVAFQRLAWEALKKSIHGHINKINVGNIGIIIKELLKENIVRGRGLLCRSVIQAQAASPTFTNVYAALVAAVNSRFPNIGELLLKRLVIQFKRGFKRNDKAICISSASFIAHLVNQRVAHEILALELLTLLVETPTDDSVEVAIAFLKECGQKLTEVSSKGVNAIFEMLRNILHEGQLDKRVQYMIEVMFQVWKDGFKDHPALIEELELVPEEEQFTHLLMLDDATDSQDILNVFKLDDKYEENEQKYKTLSKEILGSDAESDDEEGGSGESGSEESDEEEEEGEQKPMTIIDNTETNLVALRRTIYLTINSSLDFEECAHKLMKMQLKPGQEVELCHMFLDCCAEQRTYEKFYGLLAQRFCNINRMYIGPFEEIFKDSYGTAHRLDTNRLRNVSKFFAHLLFTDSIGWEVLECVRLNEEDTTSSSRIYIKILFQELAEYMGLKKLNDRLKDPTLQGAFSGVFPRDNPKNTRFSINFFTSIGLGGLTDELREHLKQMPKNVPPPVTEINIEESDSSSSSSSDSSSDSSSGEGDSDEEDSSKKKRDKKKGKDKTSDKPEDGANKNVERWGHDGFYDTYGKDATRHERPERNDRPERHDRLERNDRPERQERDRDGFARPRDVRQDNRRYDKKNNDRREDVSRRDDRGRHDDEPRSRDEERRKEDSRSRDDATQDVRKRRDDDNQEDRRRRDDATDRERSEESRSKNRDRNADDGHKNKSKRDQSSDSGDSRRDDRRKRDEDEHKSRDERRRRDDRNGERDEHSRRRDDEQDARKRNDDDRQDARKRRDDGSQDSRKRNDDDRQDSRKRRDYDNQDATNRRDDDSQVARKRNDDDSQDARKRRDDDSRDARKRHDDDRQDSRKRRDDAGDRDRKRDDRHRAGEDPRRTEDSRSKNYEGDKRDKKSDGHKSKPKKKRDQSSDSSSDSDATEKENRHKKKSKGKKKSKKYDSDSTSSSDDDERSSRKVKEDGWDIRGSSLRREIVSSGRYWNN